MDGRSKDPINHCIVTDRTQEIYFRPLPRLLDVRNEDSAAEVYKLPKEVSNIPTVMKVIFTDVAFG